MKPNAKAPILSANVLRPIATVPPSVDFASEPIAIAPVQEAIASDPIATDNFPLALDPSPIATAQFSVACAPGPIATESLPVAPSLFLFTLALDFTETYLILLASTAVFIAVLTTSPVTVFVSPALTSPVPILSVLSNLSFIAWANLIVTAWPSLFTDVSISFAVPLIANFCSDNFTFPTWVSSLIKLSPVTFNVIFFSWATLTASVSSEPAATLLICLVIPFSKLPTDTAPDVPSQVETNLLASICFASKEFSLVSRSVSFASISAFAAVIFVSKSVTLFWSTVVFAFSAFKASSKVSNSLYLTI